MTARAQQILGVGVAAVVLCVLIALYVAFGKVWQVPRYWKCVSRATGLTCPNRAGHGWWLGRLRGSRPF
jgi:hypothetical protein